MTPKAVSQSADTVAADAARLRGDRSEHRLNAIFVKRGLALCDEAAFLWSARRALACSPAVTLDVLTRFDDRLLRLVYRLGDQPAFANLLLEQEHGAYKAGHAFVTAILGLISGATSVFDALLRRLECDPDFLLPLASALSWLEYRDVRRSIDSLFASSSTVLNRLGIKAAVAHCVHPGAALRASLDSDEPLLRAAASEAVGRLGLQDYLPRLSEVLTDPDPAARFWAAWSSTRLGDRNGIPILGRFITDRGPFAIPACDIALRVLEGDRAIRVHSRLTAPDTEPLAVIAAGIIGYPSLADWLFDAMASSILARGAGAAFSLMTGRDLLRSDLDAAPPVATGDAVPSVTVTAGEDADSVDILSAGNSCASENEDALVWPDVRRLRQWWNGNRSAFVPGVRYVAGLPVGPSEMAQVLQSGNQPQRAAAALELSLVNPDAPLLDVTAPAHRQLAMGKRVL